MNAISVITVALNILYFAAIVAAMIEMLADPKEFKTGPIPILFFATMDICFALNIFLIVTR